MSSRSRVDEMQIARYLDGEMSAADRAGFESRLQEDAALRAALQAAEESCRILREACPAPLRAPAGFRSGVLDAVRRMPSREELVQLTTSEENVAQVVAFARRLLVAAAVILGLGLLLGLDLLRADEGAELQADEADQQLMDQRDAKARHLLEERLRQK